MSREMSPFVIDLVDPVHPSTTVAGLRRALAGLPDDVRVHATTCCCGEGLVAELPMYGPPAPPPRVECGFCKGTGSMYQSTGVRQTLLGLSAVRWKQDEECPICDASNMVVKGSVRECVDCRGHGFVWPERADLGDIPDQCSTCNGYGHVASAPF